MRLAPQITMGLPWKLGESSSGAIMFCNKPLELIGMEEGVFIQYVVG